MTLGEKLRHLREVEGTTRGLDRPLAQSEVVRLVREELKQTISQAYLSQVENGRRKHLTETTRMLLARFFNVHPGYLVNDPEGLQNRLKPPVHVQEDSLDLWLVAGAERFASDSRLSAALLALSRNEDSRRCILLLGVIAELPGLIERLGAALKTAEKLPEKLVRPLKGGKRK